MFRSDWYSNSAPYIVIAIGLILIIAVWYPGSYLQGYQSANEKRQAEISQYHAYQENHKECLTSSSSMREFEECFSSEKYPSAESDRAYQDLNAQREMADWAELMFWATVTTAVIAGIGVVFVAFTIAETRRLGQVQTRAYLSFNVEDFEIKENKIMVKWQLVNSGQTPARHVQFRQTSVAEPEPFKEEFHICEVTDTASVVEIAAGGKKIQTVNIPSNKPDADGITKQDISDVLSDSQSLWICFYASYDDVFGRRFYTKGRYKFGVINGCWNMYVTPDGNESI